MSFLNDVKFVCSSCQQSLEATEEMFGSMTNCPTCQNVIKIPRTIDDKLLSDGLFVFLQQFINYHTCKEGDVLAKWMINICDDPRFLSIVPKLHGLHCLSSEIYQEVCDIIKKDNELPHKQICNRCEAYWASPSSIRGYCSACEDFLGSINH